MSEPPCDASKQRQTCQQMNGRNLGLQKLKYTQASGLYESILLSDRSLPWLHHAALAAKRVEAIKTSCMRDQVVEINSAG